MRIGVPLLWRFLPMTAMIEPIGCRFCRHLAQRTLAQVTPQMVYQLVLEDSYEPRSLSRLSQKCARRNETRNQRFLHQVFGNVWIAHARQRAGVERIPMLLKPAQRQ